MPALARSSIRRRFLPTLDSLLGTGFLIGLALAVFLAGALSVVSDTLAGRLVADAYRGGQALYDKLTRYDDVVSGNLWADARRPDRGVTVYDRDRARHGATLYTSGHAAAAFLVGMDGRRLHEWRRPFSTVWNDDSPIRHPQPDSHVYFRKARAFPNGDLLALYEAAGDTPYGYGLVKLDRNSEVVWFYPGRAHHDFDVGPDGRIYVLSHEISEQGLDGFGNLAPPRLDDYLDVLSPDGRLLERVPLIEAVARSPFSHLLHTVSSYAAGDPLHANAVDVVRPAHDARFAPGRPGQVVLSFRELGAVAVLDLARREIVWATRGPWIGQHDPDLLDNGNILLFDNLGNYEVAEGPARVIEVDPRSMAIAWQYAGTPDHPLDSMIRAQQQRLDNGNTLITESSGGRILEVTPGGDIVWELMNPVRASDRPDRIPVVCGAERLPPDYFHPDALTSPVPLKS